MIDSLVFPDVRSCLEDLIDGTQHLGETVRFVWYLPADAYGRPEGPFPIVLVNPPRGEQGFLDRVDRVMLECYAPGTQAVDTLESISASIVGTDIDTPSGYLDSVRVVATPEDVPYESDTLNRAILTVDITTRPVS